MQAFSREMAFPMAADPTTATRGAVHLPSPPLGIRRVQPRPSQIAQAVTAARVHPHAAKIAEVAAEVGARIADGRLRHSEISDVAAVAQRVGLEPEDAQTEFGNILAILERGAEDAAERAIVATFVAAGAVRKLEVQLDDEAEVRRWAERLCYLAAHAGFDPLGALPEGTDPRLLHALFRALVDHARQIDEGKAPKADRAELLVAAAALADAVEMLGDADELAPLVSRLGADVADLTAGRIITAHAAAAPSTVVASAPSSASVKGYLAPLPRGAFVTCVQAFTGYLLVRSVAVLIARLALSLKRDARIELTQRGLEIDAKVGLLGREVRTLRAHYPASGVASITREVRFPSIHIYVGLAALLLGTYAGVTFLAWGVPSASPRLIAYGLLALLLGVVLDLVLTALVPGARGTCRVVVTPRRGSRVCVAGVDAQAADRLLADLARRLD